MTPHHVNVFFVDPRNGWVATLLTVEDYQIGEGSYSYLKTDAIGNAKSIAKRHGLPVHIFGKNGLEQRVAQCG
jgi:hypothetical protein